VPLRVVALRGAAPAEWGADFRTALGRRGALAFEARPQFSTLWKELGDPAGKGSAGTADAVSLGDEWLGPAIATGRLQPVPDAETARWWVSRRWGRGWRGSRRGRRRAPTRPLFLLQRSLSPRWQALLRRDPATGRPTPRGRVYGAPFRWGCTLLAARPRSLAARPGARPVADWGDLVQPALRGRVAFSESPREFLTAALGVARLPPSPTAAQLSGRGPRLALRDAVARLRDAALLISDRDAPRALASGDALAAVGSSATLAPLAMRSSAVETVAPASGTALWADVWAVPAFAGGGVGGAGPSPLLPAWLELPLAPARADPALGLRGGGASPLLLPAKGRGWRPAAAGGEPSYLLRGALPPPAILAASEFLTPPDDDVAAAFRDALAG